MAGRGLRELAGHAAAHVVDHDVEPAERLVGRPGQAGGGVEVGQVGRHDDRPPARGLDLFGHARELGLGAGRDGHVGARLGQGHGDGGADAAPGARHHGCPVGQPEPVEDHALPPALRPVGACQRADSTATAARPSGGAARPGGGRARAGPKRGPQPTSGSSTLTASGPRPSPEVPVLRMSRLLVRTLREDPAEAEVPGHRLLVRAGYVRRVAPGIHTWLPLGFIVFRNVEHIVREEMERAGAQEVHFPALLPRGPTRLPVAGTSTATTCSASRTGGAPTTCWGRRTRRCSPCWSRTCARRTRTCPCRCSRSRASTATRPVPVPDCCGAASSS